MKKIRETQEIEYQIELEKAEEIKLRKDFGSQIETQEIAKKDLEQYIAEARTSLAELEKQSKMSALASQNTQAQAPKKSKPEDELEVNID